MKTKIEKLRARILKDMRYCRCSPPASAYVTRTPYSFRHYFGADTRELLDRVVKIAQREERKAKR